MKSLADTRTHVPLKRETRAKKTRSRINPISQKRRSILKEYTKLKAEFLKNHPFCQHYLLENYPGFALCVLEHMALTGQIKAPKSEEIHHKKGRARFMLDTSTWMAVRAGHDKFIHGDPKSAYAKGYMLPRR